MSMRRTLSGVVARDHRYGYQAYVFIFEALEHTKTLRKRARAAQKPRRRRPGEHAQHVSGRELCEGARDLAIGHYGLMALTVLAQWGIHSTADLGEIVYNLIRSGELEKTPHDSRADFDGVFDFEEALRREFVVPLDEVA